MNWRKTLKAILNLKMRLCHYKTKNLKKINLNKNNNNNNDSYSSIELF